MSKHSMRSGALSSSEGGGDLLQGPRAGGEVRGALGLVQRQGLLGVARDGRHQVLLVAALRNAQGDVASRAGSRASR